MNSSPKPARPRYQKIRELGNNRAGGRVTYLATDTQTGQPVVIKQFQFAQSGADWSGFKAYEREIQVLSSLNHPGIPRYLNSFETSSGFCMVQEYKDAQPLSDLRRCSPEQIKQIALSVLNILVYLQSRIPPVIHRDIKPANILVDEQLNVYLVDFGLARIGGGEGAMSSVAAGTFGFMAPEQIYNRQLTEATDLYGLGATLICLLAGIKSEAIETLIEDTGRINFKSKLSKLSPRSIEWLEKMVQPKPKDRYPSAKAAKEALEPLNFTAVPQVRISEKSLLFAPPRFGEKMTKIIKVSNPVANAVLEGRWEVAPHPNDVPVKGYAHPWISVTPAKFKGNQVECSITVDTSKLVADAVYTRQLLLQANSEPSTQTVTLEVHAGSVPAAPPKNLYTYLIGAIVLLAIGAVFPLSALYLELRFTRVEIYGVSVRSAVAVIASLVWLLMGALVGGSRRGSFYSFVAIPAYYIAKEAMKNIEYELATRVFKNQENLRLAIDMNIWGEPYYFFYFFFRDLPIQILLSFPFFTLGNIVTVLFKKHREAGFSGKISIRIAALTAALGASLGTWLGLKFYNSVLRFDNPYDRLGVENTVLLAAAGAGFWLAATVRNELAQRQKLIAQYRKSEPHRIKP